MLLNQIGTIFISENLYSFEHGKENYNKRSNDMFKKATHREIINILKC